ncbi:BspA family leucine-rich repeat surface protein [Enterococcus termitis]
MDAMFAGANVLPSSVLNEFISSFDTRNTTNFSNMFSNCRSLTSFDNPFNLASAQDISNMFSNSGMVSFIAKNLNLLDNTYREVNANNMFRSCSAMVNFDSTDADFTNIVNSQYMFAECTNLEAITLPKISKYSPLSGTVTTLRGYMFSGCSKLVTVDLSNFYALNLNEFIRMNYMFQNCHSLKIVIFSTQFINRIVDVTALFMNCTSLEEFSGYFSANANVSMNNMFSGCTSLKKAEITSRYVESRNNMFLNCTNLEEVSFSTSFASVSAVNTASMFSGCQSLTKVSMGGNSMTNVTDMSNMFLNCLSLVDVDMSSWTVTPRTLTNMFSGCVQLEELDFMNWNTNNVTAANNMFADCVRLKKLHLGPNFRFWNTGVALPSIDTTSSVFSGGWIGENAELRFDSSVDFVTSYSGQSDTYIWEEAEPWIEVILPVSMMFYGEPLDGFLQSINSPEYSFTNLSSVPITLSIDSIQNGRDLDRLFLLHLHGEPYLYDIDLIIGGNIITVTAFDALTLNSGESEILTFSGDARAQSSESNPYFEIIFKLSI